MRILTQIFLLSILLSCGQEDSSKTQGLATPTQEAPREQQNPLKELELVTPNRERIKTELAYTREEKNMGLQGVRDEDFDENQGKLFFYHTDSTRTFWMPNTFFDLHIFYLDKNLTITDIAWNVPHYSGNVASLIPRAPAVSSRHVLEMKASSTIASKLREGDSLSWQSTLTYEETEEGLRNLHGR